ncbi:hypothetical protein Tco_0876693 [Tanacetum coccineum]|uniref:Uncharacterized protein n=1 Tax=Tanacetum coccineum TaxID=301880 RepID=A0ABQ5BVY3_9ASTR
MGLSWEDIMLIEKSKNESKVTAWRRVTLKPSSYKICLSASVDSDWTDLFCRPEFIEHSVPGLVSEA